MYFYYDHMKLGKLDTSSYAVGILETARHIHHEAEMVMVIKGRLRIEIANASCSVSEGGMFFVNPHEVHGYKAETESCLVVTLGISGAMINNLFSDMEGRRIDFIVLDMENGSYHIECIRALMFAIYKNITADDSDHEALNHAASYSILSVLHKQYAVERAPVDAESDVAYDRNNQIAFYINENFDKDIGINDLAKHIHLSPFYTSHYFKRVFKQTFVQYLTETRLLSAKYMLLKKREMTITEIALSCGFSNSANFSRVFRTAEGISPMKFRERFKSRISIDDWDNRGVYRTRSGFYVAYTKDEFIAMRDEFIAKQPPKEEKLYKFFTTL